MYQTLASKYATYDSYVYQLGLSDFSKSFDDNSVFPFSVRFEPNPEITKLFTKDAPGPDDKNWIEQLKSIP